MAPLHDARCPGIGRGDRGGATARHTEQWIEDFMGEEKKTGIEENGGQRPRGQERS
jgi:hypothetical protein